MEVDELGPFEKVLEQISCVYQKSETNKKGVMIITNCRVLWKPSAEATFPVQIFRAPLHSNNRAEESRLIVKKKPSKKMDFWVLFIRDPTLPGDEGDFYFRFVGPSAQIDCDKVEQLLR